MSREFSPTADIFPLMGEADLRALADDIRSHGLREPIVLRGARILDGRNRYLACQMLGIEPESVSYEGEDPLAYVLSENLHRRHLNESQRAMVAARLANLTHGQKKADTAIAVSQPEAAATLNVSVDSVQRAQQVIAKAEPELVAAVDQGYIPVSAGASLVDMSADYQRTIVEKVTTGSVRTVKDAKRAIRKEEMAALLAGQSTTDRYRLLTCDLADADIEPGSIDFIFTDPPYSREYLPEFGKLAGFAGQVLKPGGSLLLMSGQSYLPDVMKVMNVTLLTYQWTLAYLTPGGQSAQMWERRVNTFWKPVLWYTKGEYAGQWIGDVCRSAVNDNDKFYHHWGQSESGMGDLMGRFVVPGDTICDPFMGGGSTAVVALDLGCYFLGIDRDPSAAVTTARRLA